MAFNATTVKPLYKWMKIGINPAAGVTGGGLTVGTKNPSRAQKTVWSAGQEIWFWNLTANVGITSRTFDNSETSRWVELWSPGDVSDVTGLDTRGSSLISLNSDTQGTFDFSAFPSISIAVIYSSPIWKVKGFFNNGTPLFRSSITGPQDFSECTGMTQLLVPISVCNDLILPPAVGNTGLTLLQFQQIRLVNKDVILPAYSALTTLDMTSGGGNITGEVNTLNISAVPTLNTLLMSATGTKDFVYSSTNTTALTNVNFSNCRFSSRVEYGGSLYGNGTTTGLIPFLRNAVNLNRLFLGTNSFSGTELADIITELHTTKDLRPTNTSKTLGLSGGDINFPYPSLATWQDANDSIVDTSTRNKIIALLRENWFISYVQPRCTMSFVTGLGSTRVRCTFTTDQNIQTWAIGHTVIVSNTTQASSVPNGFYQIASTSPGGKVWDLEALPGNTPLNITSGVNTQRLTVDRPISYRFRMGTANYTDTAGNVWPFVSNGSVYTHSQAVAVSQETSLYRSMCTGTGSITLGGLLNGNYVARLHFFDDVATAAGQRVFSVSFDGTQGIEAMDIRSEVGYRTALQKEVLVTVAGNQTVLTLGANVGSNAALASSVCAVEMIRLS